ncbi:chromosome partitioning protein ParB [Plantibacter sp. Leaf171]|uniref:ParB/RepB/Spo0J family partition protein n=1 Tax=unclassified Plantibacter TaxID=2624265 RepID=UPI0006FF80AE|nr:MULTISPECIES: ParB/RepB/Spo0J family partition protein [unclassified Plantibacter]KQM16728.1 chromosome partitioning protein ParB [Plantibacter sp. Leaf1]KQR59864.1 chromosome partitioning protein ParB [Plantibacter sp. Leaf171]
MATKRTGLGRGIGALIPTTSSDTQANRPVDVFFPDNQGTARKAAKDAATAAADAAAAAAEPQAPSSEATPSDGPQLVAVPGARLAYLSPALIVPNANQPRTVFDEDHLAELVTSIREVGVLQPIVVRPIPGDDEQYELIMGERRLRASKEVGLDRIPAIIKDTADEDMLRDALLENLHRSELNPLEEASAYQQLLADFGITQDELANRIGRSRPQISNTIRLLKLPAAVQQRVAAGVLSAGHARAILSLTDPEAQQRLADKIVNEDLSVRAAEAAAAQGVQAKKPRPIAGSRRGQLDEIADRLGDRLNTRVKVTLGAKKGQMVVEFATIADLNRILSELGESGFGQSS